VTTTDNKSIVEFTLEKSTTADTVDAVLLVPPVIVSLRLKVPSGIVMARLVADGTLVTVAVAPLVPPVIVSATVYPVEDATEIVNVPAG
jgi:hypothetical protein